MDVALALGCRVMRVVCGDQYSWTGDPAARHERLANLRGPLTTIAKQAEQLDLVVAVENHADATATEIADLVASVDSTHLGTCFDAGNAARVGEDLLQAVAATRPFCVMAHLRDLKLQEASRGDPTGWWPCVALGQGDLGIPSVLEALAGAGRCRAWLVETSNLWPGGYEPEIVQTSLAYLRHWFAGLDATIVG
jgi:sugar phosphate isomerase/epimerase